MTSTEGGNAKGLSGTTLVQSQGGYTLILITSMWLDSGRFGLHVLGNCSFIALLLYILYISCDISYFL